MCLGKIMFDGTNKLKNTVECYFVEWQQSSNIATFRNSLIKWNKSPQFGSTADADKRCGSICTASIQCE